MRLSPLKPFAYLHLCSRYSPTQSCFQASGRKSRISKLHDSSANHSALPPPRHQAFMALTVPVCHSDGHSRVPRHTPTAVCSPFITTSERPGSLVASTERDALIRDPGIRARPVSIYMTPPGRTLQRFPAPNGQNSKIRRSCTRNLCRNAHSRSVPPESRFRSRVRPANRCA